MQQRLLELLIFHRNPKNSLKTREIPSVIGKVFILFGFCFLIPVGSQSKYHSKIKIDGETVKDVNLGIKNIDNMELVLKRFFKRPGDYRRIDKDLNQLAKSIKKMNWYAETRNNELFVKSGKKVLFKFRLLSEGKKIRDFSFNFNGRKFTINPSRSYVWHKRKLENILGLSRTSLLETLVIREARAFFFLAAVFALAAVGATAWSRNARASRKTEQLSTPTPVASAKKPAPAPSGDAGESEKKCGKNEVVFVGADNKECIKKSDCEEYRNNQQKICVKKQEKQQTETEEGPDSSNPKTKTCPKKEKEAFYKKCKEEQYKDIYDLKDSLNLSYTHFKKGPLAVQTTVQASVARTPASISQAGEDVRKRKEKYDKELKAIDKTHDEERESCYEKRGNDRNTCVIAAKNKRMFSVRQAERRRDEVTAGQTGTQASGVSNSDSGDNNNSDAYKNCLNKFSHYSRTEERCERPGYVKMKEAGNLMYLGHRLDKLIEISVKKVDGGHHPDYEKFEQDKCTEFATEEDPQWNIEKGWGMTKRAANQYCIRAGKLHNLCVAASKKCSKVEDKEYKKIGKDAEAESSAQ